MDCPECGVPMEQLDDDPEYEWRVWRCDEHGEHDGEMR